LKVLIYLIVLLRRYCIKQEFGVLWRAAGAGTAEATIGMFTGVWEL
jgi:hypothetical protein